MYVSVHENKPVTLYIVVFKKTMQYLPEKVIKCSLRRPTQMPDCYIMDSLSLKRLNCLTMTGKWAEPDTRTLHNGQPVTQKTGP